MASRQTSACCDNPASVPPRSISRSTARHADAAAVGEDGKPLAREGLLAAERLGRGEELVEIEHGSRPARRNAAPNTASDPASAPVWVAAARAPCSATSRFDDDDRLHAGRRADADMNLRASLMLST